MDWGRLEAGSQVIHSLTKVFLRVCGSKQKRKENLCGVGARLIFLAVKGCYHSQL